MISVHHAARAVRVAGTRHAARSAPAAAQRLFTLGTDVKGRASPGGWRATTRWWDLCVSSSCGQARRRAHPAGSAGSRPTDWTLIATERLAPSCPVRASRDHSGASTRAHMHMNTPTHRHANTPTHRHASTRACSTGRPSTTQRNATHRLILGNRCSIEFSSITLIIDFR